MIRKNQRPLYFTDSQEQQLRRNNYSLRKLNRAALGALRRIRSTALTNAEYRDAGDSFVRMANQMMSALRVRRELIAAGRERLPESFELLFGGICDACSKNKLRTKPDDHEADSRKALEQDPAHQAEIESLLELVLRIEARVSVRCESGHAPPRAFFSGIGRLISAVLRQQKDLRETALKHQPPEIKVSHASHCLNCHQPFETVDEEGNVTMP
jgi:hypothetical protein